MIGRKQSVVDQTCEGVKFLMKKNDITVFEGLGSFKDKTHIDIKKSDGKTETIEAKNIIIATGSKPSNLPFITLDKERIITFDGSTEAEGNSEAYDYCRGWRHRTRTWSGL